MPAAYDYQYAFFFTELVGVAIYDAKYNVKCVYATTTTTTRATPATASTATASTAYGMINNRNRHK